MSTPASSRLAPLDSLRGCIMVLMALDHASAFIAGRHSSEFWGGMWTHYHGDAVAFLTRFVTHLCAPGFYFLMGAGMALFAASRAAAGWSGARVAKHLFLRGMLLLAINQLLENPAFLLGTAFKQQNVLSGELEAPPGAGSQVFLFFTVLAGLGMVMAACAYFMRMGARFWIGVGAAAIVATGWLTPAAEQARTAFPLWKALLLAPGQTGHAFVLYPLIPWLGPAALGVAFGKMLRQDAVAALRKAPFAGAGMVALALGLRAAGGFGNLRLPRDGSWIEFLNMIKYPPAPVFTLFTVGADLVLLGFFVKISGSWLARTIEVYGRTPLAYFVAHLYLYAVVGLLFPRGAPLGVAYAWWVAGLAPLYWFCRRYAEFKAQKPAESIWRFF